MIDMYQWRESGVLLLLPNQLVPPVLLVPNQHPYFIKVFIPTICKLFFRHF